MNTHSYKKQDIKSQSVAKEVIQKQSVSKSTSHFVDNRPELVSQEKMKKMANNSPQANEAAQLQAIANNNSARQQQAIQKKDNKTGLPNNLKTGIENLSGYSMDDVKVHHNSDKPAQLQAHAYAQGTDIHLETGQDKHLPHEAWHVVQQKQGRVKPTIQMKGNVNVNNDAGLEKEADLMGEKALNHFENLKSNDLLEDSMLQKKSIPFLSDSEVAQRAKKPNSVATEPNTKKEKASPFQILATQFNARYDIYIFNEQIINYFTKQSSNGKFPVFELRMYDGVNHDLVNSYLNEANKLIEEAVQSAEFELIISWLRDEVKDPKKDDGEATEELYQEFIQIVRSFSKHYDSSANNQALISQYIELETKGEKTKLVFDEIEKLFDLIGDPMDALISGKLMLPIPEAYELYESNDNALVETLIARGSIHEKAVAYLVLSGRAKGLKIVGSQFTSEEEPPKKTKGRQRSNSTVKPAEVAFANLVMGDESESAKLVTDVVYKAFNKKAEVVHLIVEDKGMDKSLDRIVRQCQSLEGEGFEILSKKKIDAYTPTENAPAAEQSGVQLDEPLRYGKTTRDRWLLTVGKGFAIHPLSFNKWKDYRGYYHDDMDEVLWEEYREYMQFQGINIGDY